MLFKVKMTDLGYLPAYNDLCKRVIGHICLLLAVQNTKIAILKIN